MVNQNFAPQPQNPPQQQILLPPKNKNLLLFSLSGLIAGVSALITGLSINGFPDNAPIEFLENFLITGGLFGLAFTLGILALVENSKRKKFISYAAQIYAANGDATVNDFIVQPQCDILNKIFIGVNVLFLIITFFAPIIIDSLSNAIGLH